MEFIHCNGGNIHYRFLDNQSNRTFFFINSLGTDFRIWDETVARLMGHGNIMLYDKRGHGLSEFTRAGRGLYDYAEDALALLRHAGIEKCTIIGISIGGMIGQILGHQSPGLCDKLILCDTASRIGTLESWNSRINQVRSEGLQSITGELMKRWFSRSFHERHPEKVEGYRSMVERCPLEGYVQACESIRDADTADAARKIKAPVLCIVGSEDPSTTPAEAKSLAGLIPGAECEIIQGSAHMPCIDNPDLFTDLIIDFIKYA